MLLRAQNTASKPDGIPLHDVLGYGTLDLCLFTCGLALVEHLKARVDAFLQILLESGVEAFEKSGTTGQDDVVVELDTVLDGTRLNGVVQNFLNGLNEVLMDKFLNKNKIP